MPDYLTSDEHFSLMNFFYFCIFDFKIAQRYIDRQNDPLKYLSGTIQAYYDSKESGGYTGD